jgi:outer membrane protein TolC
MMRLLVLSLLSALPGAAPLTLDAQARPDDGDSLRLGTLQNEAVRKDPRGRQLDLLSDQSALRLRNLDAERIPTLGLNGSGQYQSDVPLVPFQLPGGAVPSAPPHDTYDANVGVRQRLYDPTRSPRRDLERARLAESQARVRSSLFALRQSVNDAFFTALLLQAQTGEVETVITDLEAQLGLARNRVRLGSGLPSESAMLEAELLRRRESLAELVANRDAALVVLGDLVGRTVSSTDALALPDLAADVTRARASLGDVRARPEYAQFDRSRDVLAMQEATVAAQDRPRVSAFARAGYGRPGLNPLGREFDAYWLGGVQLEWTPWNWGSTGRDREALELQQRIVAADEAAFTESVRRSVVRDLATIDRLERSLAADDSIVVLRERILRETRLRFGEGVISSAEFVDRQTDVLAARVARATHRVELAQARARFLTTVGLEVR